MFTEYCKNISNILSETHGDYYPVSYVDLKNKDFRNCIHIQEGAKAIPYKDKKTVELIFPKRKKLLRRSSKVSLEEFLVYQGIKEEDLEITLKKINNGE